MPLHTRPHVAAGIDIGTNAVKCCVARIDGGRLTVLAEQRMPTRLGEGWSAGGRLLPAAIARTCAAVCAMAEEARALGAETVRAAGTSAAREAANTRELATCLRETCGLALEVLSGEEEARLTFVGVASAEHAASGRLAVFDTGGGSTEWAVGEAGRLEWARSVPLGAVRLTERYLTTDPAPARDLEALAAHIRATLAALPDVSGHSLVATGGTAHTMAAVHSARYGPAPRGLTRAEVDRQIAFYASRSVSERRTVPGMDADRADIILAGALIVRGCMEAAGAASIRVSSAGVRHGLLLEGA